MKRLLLLFLLCLLLANTELRAQNDTQRLLQLLKSLCVQGCYSKYQNAISPEAIYYCYKYYPWHEAREYCSEERIRARAREEYEMCLLSCMY
jgi:predicted PolB exonuclease-like 3'-5' exonuclease